MLYDPYDKVQIIRDNISAIKTLKTIQLSGQTPTDAQSDILRKWRSWGGCSAVFTPFVSSDRSEVAKLHTTLRGLLTDSQWNQAMKTTINAHYTDPFLVQGMWALVERLLPQGGRALEIGCGSGNFLVDKTENWDFTGIELDPISAHIGQILNPKATIINDRIEATGLDDGKYDLVIGNVPFASIVPYDRIYNKGKFSLHDYCICRGIHALKDGGLMAVITSKFTMDKHSDTFRQWLAERADLLYALRLPSTAHSAFAGTTVVSDILILRKKNATALVEAVSPEIWTQTSLVDLDINWKKSATIRVNSGFYNNASMDVNNSFYSSYQKFNSLPTLRADSKFAYAECGEGLDACMRFEFTEFDLPRMTILGGIEVDEMYATPSIGVKAYNWSPPKVPLGTNAFLGAILHKIAENLAPLPSPRAVNQPEQIHTPFRGITPPPVPVGGEAELESLNNLKNLTKCVFEVQKDESVRAGLAESLLKEYQMYVSRFGNLTRKRRGIEKKVWEAFEHDFEWALVASLEYIDPDSKEVKLSKIFFEPIFTIPQTDAISNIREAITYSLQKRYVIDPDLIGEILDIDPEQVVQGLHEYAFIDPETDSWVLKEVYLSGDVCSKLEIAQNAAIADPKYTINVEALQKVLPTPIETEDIVFQFGSTWVHPDIVRKFISFLSQNRIHESNIILTHEPESGWALEFDSRHSVIIPRFMHTGKTFKAIILDCLNNVQSKIYAENTDGKRVLDEGRTLAIREICDEIKEEFHNWVCEDPNIAKQLTDAYNSVFNRIVPTKFNGDHLKYVEGMSNEFKLRKHQRDCVARILATGNTLIGHPVGAGKTAVMATTAILGKRMGIFSKPLIVVPNLAVENFSIEFRRMFPNAKLLTYGQTTSKIDRQKFIAMAGLNDWDAVIMPLSMFERIPLSPEGIAVYIEDKLTSLRDFEMRLLQAKDPAKKSIKKIQKAIESYTQKLRKMTDTSKDLSALSFEDMGVDCIYIDEIQNWKNLPITSKIEGVNSTGSQRAVDLESKLRFLEVSSKSGLYICGATGTHVSNAVWELWILWNYISKSSLRKYGLDTFDAWIREFGLQTTNLEIRPDGASWAPKSRISGYKNIRPLMRMVSTWADLMVDSDLDIPRPTVKGGKPRNVVIPSTIELKQFTSELTRRMEMLSKRPVRQAGPGDDNMLVICSEGRKAALDLRLLGLSQNQDLSKINAACVEISKIYHANKDNIYVTPNGQPSDNRGALQLVFCDIGTPKSTSWNVYDELKLQLLDKGVLSKKIRFIHEFKTPAQKERLLSMCQHGEIAILIGSTEKMGTALNIQQRLIAVHHIDPPWRPSDIQQRDGRMIRQGNQNPLVEIVRYIVEGSFDTFYWQTLERKNNFIQQVSCPNPTTDQIEEITMNALTYTESKALATGDPRLIEIAKLEADIRRMSLKQRRFNTRQKRFLKAIQQNEEAITVYTRQLEYLNSLQRYFSDSMSRHGLDDPASRKDAFALANTEFLECVRNAISNPGTRSTLSLPNGIPVKVWKEYSSTNPTVRLEISKFVRFIPQDDKDRATHLLSLANFGMDEISIVYDPTEDTNPKLATRLINRFQKRLDAAEAIAAGIKSLQTENEAIRSELDNMDFAEADTLTAAKKVYEKLSLEIYGDSLV